MDNSSSPQKTAFKPATNPAVPVEAISKVLKQPTQPDPVTANSKKSRKRAADFLSDDDKDGPEVSSSKIAQPLAGKEAAKAALKKQKRNKNKAKKQALKEKETLTADGANGVTENLNSTTAAVSTPIKPKAKSMQAEAARTQDQELEDEWGGLSEAEKAAEDVNDEEDEEEGNGGLSACRLRL